MPSNKPQVCGYAEQEVYDELTCIAASKRGLSISLLVQEAIDIAMPELRRRYKVAGNGPTQNSPGRKKKKAA